MKPCLVSVFGKLHGVTQNFASFCFVLSKDLTLLY